jgi:hypothetical protein
MSGGLCVLWEVAYLRVKELISMTTSPYFSTLQMTAFEARNWSKYPFTRFVPTSQEIRPVFLAKLNSSVLFRACNIYSENYTEHTIILSGKNTDLKYVVYRTFTCALRDWSAIEVKYLPRNPKSYRIYHKIQHCFLSRCSSVTFTFLKAISVSFILISFFFLYSYILFEIIN